jgi:hypothetical protein
MIEMNIGQLAFLIAILYAFLIEIDVFGYTDF